MKHIEIVLIKILNEFLLIDSTSFGKLTFERNKWTNKIGSCVQNLNFMKMPSLFNLICRLSALQ
jgi:hypothetical protein